MKCKRTQKKKKKEKYKMVNGTQEEMLKPEELKYGDE